MLTECDIFCQNCAQSTATNYQIEHHLWLDLSLRQYQRIQPRVRALCLAHGIPYKQVSVFRRLAASVDVIVGRQV